jgi:spermidine synthase
MEMEATSLIPSRALGVEDTRAVATVRSESFGVVALFTSALFVSAFLLFLVQPMVAKMVLPMLGGAPMVWNTCMVFFQVALLAGYAYAHGATRWIPGRLQIALHAVLLTVPFAVLPVVLQAQTMPPPEGAPVVWLLVVLAATIGLPFFVLSSSASVLQHWFSRTRHPAARDPYFLYAASNIGSFAALVAYPTIVEPLLSLPAQSRLWTSGYAVFVALVGACAIAGWRGRESAAGPGIEARDGEPVRSPSMPLRARWVVLAFVPSSLMLAVTTYLSSDIAAVPLLWIVPLGLYLLTFVAAFSSRTRSWRQPAGVAFRLLVIPLVLMMATRARMAEELMFIPHLLVFVTAAFLCHSRLADSRPSPSHLTEFYLWMSFGGMLGGIFNALAAPYFFKSVAEYPLVLVLACLMVPAAHAMRRFGDRVLDLAVPLAVCGLTAGLGLWLSGRGVGLLLAALSVPALIAFSQRRRPLRFALCTGALLVAGMAWRDGGQILHAERTFFGLYRVQQDLGGHYMVLEHGTTLHGMQAIQGPERGEPLSYYHRLGPFGQAFAALPRGASVDRVAVIGLGVGTLAAYATPLQHWTFYEIDPAVERIARDPRYFTYLQSCGDRCRVVIGDARLSLARAPEDRPEDRYDLVVLDAFSSDAIPVHLLTSEALGLYLTRLRPEGEILFHISNSHLALAPIVARLAEQHGLAALAEVDRRKPGWPEGRAESVWVAMARRREDLGAITTDARWTELLASGSTPLWTDDFSNVLGVLKFRH